MASPSVRFLVLPVLAALLFACGGEEELPPRQIAAPMPEVPENLIDLSYAFGEDTIYWPTDTQGFHHDTVSEGMTDKGYYYSAYRFSGAEHGGTHLDAPVHFYEGRSAADAIPLERLVGLGVVVDVTDKVLENRDYQVAVDDLTWWEELHGPLPEGAIVLLRTGLGRFWPDRERYLGTALRGPEAIPELHFPGLGPEAARWLRDERRVKAVGIDTASIDHGQSTLFESHVVLCEGDVPIFENVANLDQLPDQGFLVMALPMKIAGGSGGPLRIVAAW